MLRDIKSVKFFNVYGYKIILFNKESWFVIYCILIFKKVIYFCFEGGGILFLCYLVFNLKKNVVYLDY